MKKGVVFFLLFIVVIFSAPDGFCKGLYGRLYGVVTKVSDGDTVWVRLENGRRIKVRIWGIDTPETFNSNKMQKDARKCRVSPKHMKTLGKKATEFAELVLWHKHVILIPKGRGYYGRILARIIVEGRDYGLEVIKVGYACVYRGETDPKYYAAQELARRTSRGLWKLAPEVMSCLCP